MAVVVLLRRAIVRVVDRARGLPASMRQLAASIVCYSSSSGWLVSKVAAVRLRLAILCVVVLAKGLAVSTAKPATINTSIS